MNYDIYIEELRLKIIEEKLNNKRYDVIRNYQKELDLIINAKKNDMDIKFEDFTSVEIIEKVLKKEDKQIKLNQLRTYLEGLEGHSRVYKEIIVEKKSPILNPIEEQNKKDIEYVNLQQRMTSSEAEAIDNEIKLIRNQINKLENE